MKKADKAKSEKKTIKRQLSKLLKNVKNGDVKAKKIILAIKRYKTRREIEKEKKALKTGMVIDGNKVMNFGLPVNDGDVVNWNEWEKDGYEAF